MLLTTALMVFPSALTLSGYAPFVVLVLFNFYSIVVMYSLWAKFKAEEKKRTLEVTATTASAPIIQTNAHQFNFAEPAPAQMYSFDACQSLTPSAAFNPNSPPVYQEKA